MISLKEISKIAIVFLLYWKIIPNPLDLHVCTFANKTDNNGFNQLLVSCKKFNINLDVIGKGTKFSWKLRLEELQKYVSNLPKNDLVLFIDAYDVLVLGSKKELIDTFLQFSEPFVIAAETNCWPFANLSDKYPTSATPFKYVNGGSYMGYADYMKLLLDDILSKYSDDNIYNLFTDQAVLTLYYLKNPQRIALDYRCKLFFPLFGVSEKSIQIDKQKFKVKNLLTNSIPPIIHGNGSSKSLYQKIYNVLFK